MTTFLRGHGHQWLMEAAPQVAAQNSGTCLPSRRDDSSAMYAAPSLMLITHFFGSRVTVPSGQTVSGRPETRMSIEVSSISLALPEWRWTGCMPTIWNHLPMIGHFAISALAM